MPTYFSSGKLLITGEYLILDGAESVCIPTKKGQSLTATPNDSNLLIWKSFDIKGDIWFQCELDLLNFKTRKTSDVDKSEFLIEVLKQALVLNPKSKIILSSGVTVETKLDFDTTWGLGSSSTLLCNISKWLDVDAFKLHFSVSNGSGYDIACGLSNTPLLYQVKNQNVVTTEIVFNPSFKSQVYFIHLNQKQVSASEVTHYNQNKDVEKLQKMIFDISTISHKISKSKSLENFENLLLKHEDITAQFINKKTIKEQLFPDYNTGIIKSLGAWGGDFVLVTISKTSDLDYFKNRGYTTILNWKDMFI